MLIKLISVWGVLSHQSPVICFAQSPIMQSEYLFLFVPVIRSILNSTKSLILKAKMVKKKYS